MHSATYTPLSRMRLGHPHRVEWPSPSPAAQPRPRRGSVLAQHRARATCLRAARPTAMLFS